MAVSMTHWGLTWIKSGTDIDIIFPLGNHWVRNILRTQSAYIPDKRLTGLWQTALTIFITPSDIYYVCSEAFQSVQLNSQVFHAKTTSAKANTQPAPCEVWVVGALYFESHKFKYSHSQTYKSNKTFRLCCLVNITLTGENCYCFNPSHI